MGTKTCKQDTEHTRSIQNEAAHGQDAGGSLRVSLYSLRAPFQRTFLPDMNQYIKINR